MDRIQARPGQGGQATLAQKKVRSFARVHVEWARVSNIGWKLEFFRRISAWSSRCGGGGDEPQFEARLLSKHILHSKTS